MFEVWDQELAPYLAAENLTVLADGYEDPIAFDVSVIDDGDHQLHTIQFLDALPESSRIDLWLADAEVPVFGFTTGVTEDDEPPRWDGGYSVGQSSRGDTCGRTHNISVDLTGVATDEDDHPLVIAESITGGSWSVVSQVDTEFVGFELAYSEVCGGDPSVLAHHVRSFDVAVVDAAGNASEKFRVYTGCGCSTPSGAPDVAATLVITLALGLSRRRAAWISPLCGRLPEQAPCQGTSVP